MHHSSILSVQGYITLQVHTKHRILPSPAAISTRVPLSINPEDSDSTFETPPEPNAHPQYCLLNIHRGSRSAQGSWCCQREPYTLLDTIHYSQPPRKTLLFHPQQYTHSSRCLIPAANQSLVNPRSFKSFDGCRFSVLSTIQV